MVSSPFSLSLSSSSPRRMGSPCKSAARSDGFPLAIAASESSATAAAAAMAPPSSACSRLRYSAMSISIGIVASFARVAASLSSAESESESASGSPASLAITSMFSGSKSARSMSRNAAASAELRSAGTSAGGDPSAFLKSLCSLSTSGKRVATNLATSPPPCPSRTPTRAILSARARSMQCASSIDTRHPCISDTPTLRPIPSWSEEILAVFGLLR
mmetsp:Transcript_27855/g.73077  ORF Transcript_27855/g.73077 Transcript_27855/m.73077 type:complete len:217 (+) Transcript_27855:280-930(+)